MSVLQIVDWDKHFENNRSRELKAMSFVCIKNKMDGDGYTELVDHVDGDRHYACWIAIVLVASKCDPRGTLVRDGAKPHDAESICRISRMKPVVMKQAISRLLQIGWLELISLKEQEVTSIPHLSATESHNPAQKCDPYRMELNRTEGNANEGSPEPSMTASVQAAVAGSDAPDDPVLLEFPVVGQDGRPWGLTESKLSEYVATYPAMDVQSELRKARQWCIDNASNRKTAKGMPAFLGRWLAKAQDTGTGVRRASTAANTNGGNDLFAGLRASRERRLSSDG